MAIPTRIRSSLGIAGALGEAELSLRAPVFSRWPVFVVVTAAIGRVWSVLPPARRKFHGVTVMHAEAIATTGGEPQKVESDFSCRRRRRQHADVRGEDWPESWAFKIAMQMILSGASVGVATSRLLICTAR